MNPDIIEGLFIRDDDEGLFSRDIDGQLVRLDSPTEGDYDKTVTLQIDGQTVTVPLAEPLKDANGNIVQDVDGRTTPRYTTILDAATALYVKEVGDESKIPIPTLCHLPHMTPVAVCRMCVVQIYGQKRGKRAAERKLLPACQHQVKDGMEVFTMKDPGADGERVRQTVKVMTELLAVNHLKPVEPPTLEKELAPFNELGNMVHRCSAESSRLDLDVFSRPAPPAPVAVGRRGLDTTSPVFQVDHTSCILCERCVRACGEVKENNIIGRTGKGASAGVSFDLNDPMGGSGCVQCGECMVSCPTSAITFKPGARIKISSHSRSVEVLSPSELISDPLFSGIAPKFLLWQQGLVIRRRLSKGEVLCRQGDAGNTAFIIKSGRLEVTIHATPEQASRGFFGGLIPRGRGRLLSRFELTPEALIVGEMSCITGTPRTATVTALEEGEVWEVRRNVLDRLMRLPSLKEMFDTKYRERVLNLVLKESDLFKTMDPVEFDQVVDYLRTRLSFVRVNAGQALFKQGELANALYLVRLGYVRIGVKRYGKEAKVLSRGPGTILGEIGLLGLDPRDVRKTVDEVDAAIAQKLAQADGDLTSALPAGTRSATCSALGQLELARLSRADFLAMIQQFPALRRRLVELSFSRLRADRQADNLRSEYVNQGLYEGRSILVLDMDHCVRCDECTKGCIHKHGSETHGAPIPRLLRDGMRFENYLVATSCRSCTDAHCMVGCPVDSIHRGKHLQIVIEDHCIGCGLCASNCPYGSIFMVPNQRRIIEAPDPENLERTIRIGQPKAATCDLCDVEGKNDRPKPQCVASCPHDAAFRMSGEELMHKLTGEV